MIKKILCSALLCFTYFSITCKRPRNFRFLKTNPSTGIIIVPRQQPAAWTTRTRSRNIIRRFQELAREESIIAQGQTATQITPDQHVELTEQNRERIRAAHNAFLESIRTILT